MGPPVEQDRNLGALLDSWNGKIRCHSDLNLIFRNAGAQRCFCIGCYDYIKANFYVFKIPPLFSTCKQQCPRRILIRGLLIENTRGKNSRGTDHFTLHLKTMNFLQCWHYLLITNFYDNDKKTIMLHEKQEKEMDFFCFWTHQNKM